MLKSMHFSAIWMLVGPKIGGILLLVPDSDGIKTKDLTAKSKDC